MPEVYKTIGTLEMLRVLKDRKAERISDGMKLSINDDGELQWEPGHKHISLNDEWRLIKEDREVNVKEAIRAFHNGEKVCCEANGFTYNYASQGSHCLRDDEGEPVSSDELLNGKWFIKEE